MALRTQPTALQDALAGWWPSRYGAWDEAGALSEITPHALRVADHIAVRLGATGQPEARPEPVPAHA